MKRGYLGAKKFLSDLNYDENKHRIAYRELISDASSTIEPIKSDIIASFYNYITTRNETPLLQALKNAKESRSSFKSSFRTDEPIFDKEFNVDVLCTFKFLYNKKSLELRFTVIEDNERKYTLSTAKSNFCPKRYHKLLNNLVHLEEKYLTL